MLEGRGSFDLDEETLGPNDFRQLRFEDLEGHAAVVLDVLGQVDRGHAALAEFTCDGVATRQSGVQRNHHLAPRPSLPSK